MKSIGLYGLTGQGIETAGEILSKVIQDHGYIHRTWREFSTIIRGGGTIFEIYIAEEPNEDLPPRLEQIDLAVVWDDAGAENFLPRLKDKNMLFGPASVAGVPNGHQGTPPKIGYNIWSLGIIGGYLGLPYNQIQAEVLAKFNGEKNIRLLNGGYELGLTVKGKDPFKQHSAENVTISGNDALCIGGVSGGVRHYYGYPITPASEILENFSKWLPSLGGGAYQVEDEMAAIHAAIGCSYAGRRTFVATSGPGLSLMTEGLGYASATEIPLVLVDNQRGGPSTGMPTKTEQSDLLHLNYAGHGEFSRILLTPTSVTDCIVTMQEALNLADYYQCPVILALDLDLALRRISIPWSEVENAINKTKIDRGPTVFEPIEVDQYTRFESIDGKPPLRTVPGVKGGAYVASGDEHDERGFMEPDFKEVRHTLHKRRLHKADKINYHRPFTRVGEVKSPVMIIGTGALGEVIENFVQKNPYKYQGLLIRQLSPVPVEELSESLEGIEQIIVAEYNARGQIRTLLKDVFGEKEVHSLLRFDGEHFTDGEFEAAVTEISKKQVNQTI
ncbi:2-oxoacid:acceptor oxidoreductase family protein [Bacillus sp. MRMR6]|uniref:2-oxoacid:acceptor oxidoreductase family protein n=1 Tax=Bacillus sp. MRMR6 TaxID=1928617 RepID=UPI0009512EF9|nr:2-oxoacid:acceptor oxidoreductase family protein [Bacillus sp. MRMR6]OLS34508.1 hypothetical protein BTR25_22070 [Bacillus sp. MRMR6]